MLRGASRFLHNVLGSDQNNGEVSEVAVIPRIFNEPSFYGRITRSEAETILARAGNIDGLYLLRESITPMGNFSLSMCREGTHIHYSIEKQVDGKYMIASGKKFKDPIELIEFYIRQRTGLATIPRIPCNRHSSQEAIAFRGLSYQDLHKHMRDAARKINADPSKALGPLHDSMMIYVLPNIHETLPWFHGQITRDQARERLQQTSMEDGTFIVRSRKDDSSFALTMCHEATMKNYIITCSDGEKYHIDPGPRFKALVILIDHYHNKQDGLPCCLKWACCNPDCKHIDWKRYKLLSQDIGNTMQITVQVPIRPSASHRQPPPPPPPTYPPESDSDEATEEPQAPSSLISNPSSDEATDLENIYHDIRSTVMSMNLKPANIFFEGTLGSGQFGDVMKGKCRLGDREIPVAVKTLKEHDRKGQEDIENEARLMKKLDHPNIVRMIGVCSGDILMLVMELAEFGPLKKYLTRNNSMPHWHRLELMIQICEGMAYLEDKAVVHRDLATRNVLLMTEHFAKISDFGMSRMVDSDSEYYIAHAPSKWPLMWYAPECMYFHKFDSKSDVWSFGVTMWEIMSNGKKPYNRMQPAQIIRFLEEKNRLSKPANCDDGVYSVMNYCWKFKKEDRPNFKELLQKLQPLYDKYCCERR